MNINLSAPVCDSGYSLAALDLLRALDSLGHLVSLFPIRGLGDVDPVHLPCVRSALERSSFYDKGAPSVRIFHQWLLAEHVGKGPHVGFPIFELDRFSPVERHHLQSQDLVLVCSEWGRRVIEANHVTTPVRVVPLGVEGGEFLPTPLPQGPTTFLHMGKSELRKGLPEVIEAFGKAFQKTDDVRLILHCHNPFLAPEKVQRYNAEWRALALSSPLAEKIVWTGTRLRSRAEVANLMRQAHCGVFPARAEGWNLELSEMLALGRHCIATNYGGHTEFVTPESTRLVEVSGTEVAYDGVYFFGQGDWARIGPSQVEQIIQHMRDIHSANVRGDLQVNSTGVERMREFSWENSARVLVEAVS
jgi:glycosyltransferase involved in cell wall biosynthesis